MTKKASSSHGGLHPKAHLLGEGLRPKNAFGQNFLSDENEQSIIAQIAVGPSHPQAVVVEWGAGLGALTRRLLRLAPCVHVVERDRDLVPLLGVTFADAIAQGALVVHEANATTFPVEDLLDEHAPPQLKLCGNLPYHLTSKLLFRTLELAPRLLSASFLIQLEVAERIAAGPGNRTYGMLSVLLQSRFDVELVHKVPRDAFWPPPKVDGGVIRLVPLEHDPLTASERLIFTDIVKAAFQKRRKTLRNALSSYDALEPIFQRLGLSLKQRAETLNVEDYVALAKHLAERE